MLIRIVSCSIPEAWYRDNIGEEFEVLPYDNSCWIIPFPFEYWKDMPPLLILRSDCRDKSQLASEESMKELKSLQKEIQALSELTAIISSDKEKRSS